MAAHAVDAGPVNWHFQTGERFGVIGPDGNVTMMLDKANALDFMAIQGRIHTQWYREPFDPTFGIGLVKALYGNPPLTAADIQKRFALSFADDPFYRRPPVVRIGGSGGKRLIEIDLTAVS